MSALSTLERGGASGKNDNVTAANPKPIWGPAFKGSQDVGKFLRIQYGQTFLVIGPHSLQRGWVSIVQFYNNETRYYRLRADHPFYKSEFFIASGEPS